MAATAKTAAKAAGAVAAGGGPEDPVGDAAAAAIVAKDTVASKGKQQGVKDTADKASKATPDGKSSKSGGKGGKGGKGAAPKSKVRRATKFAFSGNRKILTGQFIACMAVVILGTCLAPEDSKDTSMRALVKASAIAALFFLLALLAQGGKGWAKGATALGTLVTASYVLTSSDVKNVVDYIAKFFKKPAGQDEEAASQ